MSQKATAAKTTEFKSNAPPSSAGKAAIHSQISPYERILHLQSTVGNRAVQRMYESGVLQAKLKIGQPGDRYEREADSVAERVMSMPEPVINRQEEEKEEIQSQPLSDKITPLVRRAEDKEEEIQEQPAEKEEEEPQAKLLIQREAEKEDEEIREKPLVQRQPEEEKEEPVQGKMLQRQPEEDEIQQQNEGEEEEEPVQSKLLQRQAGEEEKEEVQEKPLIQTEANEEEEVQEQPEEDEEVQTKPIVQRDTEEEKEEPQTKPLIQREAEEKDEIQSKSPVQPKNSTYPSLSPATETSVKNIRGGGKPLSDSSQSFMENRFGYDFRSVRVHTDSRADGLATSINAKAFTLNKDIVFKSGQYSPDTSDGKRLIAHELTHVVQQNPEISRKTSSLPVSQKSDTPVVQGTWVVSWIKKKAKRTWKGIKKVGSIIASGARYLLQKAKNYIAKLVRHIHGYGFVSFLLGKDPISGKKYKSKGEYLEKVFTLLKQKKTYDQLVKANIVGNAVEFVKGAFIEAKLTVGFIVSSVKDILSTISIKSPKTWGNAADKFVKFLGTLVSKVAKVVSILIKRVAKWLLEKAKKYALKLLRAISGFNIIMELFGNPLGSKKGKKKKGAGFVSLIFKLLGKEKTYDNLVKANILGKIAGIFKGAFTKAGLSWEYIEKNVSKIWEFLKKNPFSWLKAAGMVVSFVKSLVGKLFRVARNVILKVPPLILEGFLILVGAPVKKIMGILNKGWRVILKIAKNPIGFIGNLFGTLKKGFFQFMKNIWKHLKAGLMGWLMGAMEGADIKLPKKWDIKGIIFLVFQMIGLTYQRIRQKVVKKLGPKGEQIVSFMEKAVSFMVTLVAKGPMALWERIKEKAGEIKDAAISAIKGWIVTKIIMSAVTKLATMFNPVGAIVQAVLAIYNTVMFFIERAHQIAAVVQAVFNSIAPIAYGRIKKAAEWIEKTMARTIPVILGFLARLIGLGGISAKIKKVVTAIRKPIDKVVDKVVDWIVTKAKKLFKKGGAHGEKLTSDQVKKLARRDLFSALKKRKLQNVGQIDSIVGNVFGKYKPKGLKSINVNANPKDPKGKIAFVLTASPGEEIVTSLDKLFVKGMSKEEKEKKLGKAVQTSYAALSVNGKLINKISSSGKSKFDDQYHDHSEKKIVKSSVWKSETIEAATRAVGKAEEDSQESIIALAINRSPCHDVCVVPLVEARENYDSNDTLTEVRKRIPDKRKKTIGEKIKDYIKNKVTFVLSALGWYKGRFGETEPGDVGKLRHAGWKVKAHGSPSKEGKLTKRGEKWRDMILADIDKVDKK